MFVKNEPAMKIGKYLVVADIHLGLTKDIRHSGISLPSQVGSLSGRLNGLRSATKTDGLVILGDIKHKMAGVSFQEKRELPEFLRALKFGRIIITKGNHDGHLESVTSAVNNVSVRKSFSVGNYCLTHGHRNVKTSKKIIVVGHNHLCAKFRDDVGAVYTEPVWARGKAVQKDARGIVRTKTIVIMPAFNELCGCHPVNRGSFQGPVASKLKNPRIYLLDGTDIGRASDLKVKE